MSDGWTDSVKWSEKMRWQNDEPFYESVSKKKKIAVTIKHPPKKDKVPPIRSCLITRKKNGYKNEKHSFIMPGNGECSVTVHSYVCFTFQCLIFYLKVHKLKVASKEK